MRLHRVAINRIRQDGLVFATDYSECDHSTKEAREIMFRPGTARITKSGSPIDLKKDQCVSIECGYEEKGFVHRIESIEVVFDRIDTDWLLDL